MKPTVTIEMLASAFSFLAKKCPTMRLPYGVDEDRDGNYHIALYYFEDGKKKAQEIVRALGGKWDKSSDDNTFNLTRELEPGLKLTIRIFHAYVCTKEVIGKRLVPAQEARPEREEEIIRWICPDSIFEEGK
jgi:hypothetical protein